MSCALWGNTASFHLEEGKPLQFGGLASAHFIEHYAITDDIKVELSTLSMTWRIVDRSLGLHREFHEDNGGVSEELFGDTVYARPRAKIEIVSAMQGDDLARLERAFLSFLAMPFPKMYLIDFRFDGSREHVAELVRGSRPLVASGSPTFRFDSGRSEPLSWPQYAAPVEKKRGFF